MGENKENTVFYKTRDFQDCESFWDAISPIHKKSIYLMYRGQRKSEWKLEPKIMRQDDKIIERILGEKEPVWTYQILSELRLLMEFVKHCERAGLAIPGDSPEFRKKYLDVDYVTYNSNQAFDWPDEKHFELMAFAQHYDIPTRLLDWSNRSFVAAYFAASSALENRENWKDFDRLAVWEFDYTKIKLFKNLTIVNVPVSTSKNQAAQAGSFTLIRQSIEGAGHYESIELEKLVGEVDPNALTKHTLPVSESKKLLGLCDAYGVSASTLFPDYNGAARGVKDSINIWDI